MNRPNDLRDPDMHCKEGHLIPRNGEAVFGSTRPARTPLLGCPQCAIDASSHMPVEPKKVSAVSRARNPHPDQTRIDAPVIFID